MFAAVNITKRTGHTLLIWKKSKLTHFLWYSATLQWHNEVVRTPFGHKVAMLIGAATITAYGYIYTKSFTLRAYCLDTSPLKEY